MKTFATTSRKKS